MAKDSKRLRVVILGAGVSASCGIPLAKDILRESMIRLGGVDASAAKEVHSLLNYLYPDFEKAYRNYPNIEDFLNLIEMAQTFNSQEFIESDLWPYPKISTVKDTVLRAVAECIWAFFVTPQPSWRHLEIFLRDHLPVGNVVVTFNWDLTVETILSRLRPTVPVRYQYSKDERHDCITLLKPHGSINWFDRAAVQKAGISHALSLGKDSKLRLVDFPVLLHSRDLIKAVPVIVPPIANKKFDSYSVFQETWASVYRAISGATALTILGYSLPREDQFSRFVFRRALRNNVLRSGRGQKDQLRVVVVNPDETTEGTFARLVGREETSFRFHRAYFQDFVDSLPDLSQ
jgi:hypothetical protein